MLGNEPLLLAWVAVFALYSGFLVFHATEPRRVIVWSVALFLSVIALCIGVVA